MNSEENSHSFDAYYNRLGMYYKLLGVTPLDMFEDGQLTPEERETLANGVMDITIAARVLLIFCQKYGVNKDRLIHGTGPLFSFKGPGITDKFYMEHKFMFAAKDRPGRENG